jgi:hypothetical protein
MSLGRLGRRWDCIVEMNRIETDWGCGPHSNGSRYIPVADFVNTVIKAGNLFTE